MAYLVSVEEAAVQLGLSATGRRVRALLASGQLKGEQASAGSAWLVYQASIDAYTRNRKGAGRPRSARGRVSAFPADSGDPLSGAVIGPSGLH